MLMRFFMENKELSLRNEEHYARQAEICAAFSHPIRLKIVDLLLNDKLNCTQIINILKIPKPNLSQHLNVLKRARLVESKKNGLFQEYYLTNPDIRTTCLSLKETLTLQTNPTTF